LLRAGREDSPARSDEALGAVAGLIDKSLLLRAETSVPTRPLYQMLETVRARLGPDRWARAYAAGRVTSIDS
jgi:hypothetical protein